MKKRQVGETRLRKLWKATGTFSGVGRKIGYTPTGTKRALIRFGIIRPR